VEKPDGRVRPKKRLGQHFLADPNVTRKIADALAAPPGAPVVEIGPGTGALTGPLLDRHPHLTALEVDPEAIAHLRARWPALDVRHADVLDADWRALAAEKGGALWVAGNLPYYITSPILFALLDARDVLARAVVMIQREVAERIVAPPGSKTYGGLSVQTQLLARPKLLFKVSRHVFVPKPDVESAVLALDFGDAPLDALTAGGAVDSLALRRVVRAAFGQRRKALRNSLSALAAEVGRPVPDAFSGLRPEQLAPPDFVALARELLGERR
jgi:16S rRNA (adenine1518-N6/adenine1519-N6)-dimethyltransferase